MMIDVDNLFFSICISFGDRIGTHNVFQHMYSYVCETHEHIDLQFRSFDLFVYVCLCVCVCVCVCVCSMCVCVCVCVCVCKFLIIENKNIDSCTEPRYSDFSF